jgi:hypothetical protein
MIVAVGKLIVTFFERLANRIFTTDIVRVFRFRSGKWLLFGSRPIV